MEVNEICEKYPEVKQNATIVDAFTKAASVLRKSKVAVCTISGGRQ